MIKFEEHEGQLFRMLEEPKFLEPGDSKPFLIRLIADDSRMGKYNRGMYSKKELSTKYVLELVSLGACVMVSSGNLDSIECYQYEIIGYHVAEGSVEWAWYQMMKGEKITSAEFFSQRYYAIKKGCDYCAFYENDGNEVCINTRRTYGEFIEYSKRCDMLSWIIYKEPKSQYKVGDWVEFIDDGGRKSQGKYLSNTDGNAVIVLDITCNMKVVVHTTKIIRKLSPSKVVIRIGCMSGTVAEFLPGCDCDWVFKLIHGNGKESYISPHALDSHTRELVESLLKAQEEE